MRKEIPEIKDLELETINTSCCFCFVFFFFFFQPTICTWAEALVCFVVFFAGTVTEQQLYHGNEKIPPWLTSTGLAQSLLTALRTFNSVPEALWGGGVVGWSVEGVELQTVQNILGLRQPLNHGPSHVACWVPPYGAGLCVWVGRSRRRKREIKLGGDTKYLLRTVIKHLCFIIQIECGIDLEDFILNRASY